MKLFIKILPLFLFVFVACKTDSKKEKSETWRTKEKAIADKTHNQLLDIEKEQGWTLLFDGKTLNGWHLYNFPDSLSVWEVKNGELHCNALDESKPHGDLVTDNEFENYELVLDWKHSYRGNSGIFLNVQEKKEIATAWQSGPEYQLLDPAHADQRVDTKKSGCLYGFAPQLNKAVTKPDGQWNHTRIKQVDGKVEFYLNGVLTGTEDFKSSAWANKVSNSGFSNYSEFGKASKGKIALQDWYFEISFRNIKIKEL